MSQIPWPATVRARRTAFGTAVACAALTALLLALFAPGRRGWFDVGVYWGTANWWRHGGDIYSYLHPGTSYGFTYPPFALLCLLPLSLFNWPGAVVLALLVNLGCAALLLHWLVGPLIRRQGWHRWGALVLAGSLLAVFGPVRDSISFGQVNLVLLVLVLADLRLLTRDRADLPAGGGAAAWAGVGIGLAGAVKLTPLLFIGYLLLAREWRAARVAGGTFLGATALAALVAPAESVEYWTHTIRETGRVGDLGYVSNQSLLGLYTRLHLDAPGRWPWLIAVLAVLAAWAVLIHRSAPASQDRPDHRTGFALTGVAACLASPVTWVHHLVWVLPALVLLLDIGLRRPDRRWLLGVVAVAYLVFSIGLVWIAAPATGLAYLLGANAGTWVCLALLGLLPVADAPPRRDRDGWAVVGRYARRP